MPKFKWLRELGPIGAFIANALMFLTTNWGVVASALIGLLAGLSSWAVHAFQIPAVYVSVGVFLAALWTVVGVTSLMDRRRPRLIQPYQDYRYGLTFEGLAPVFTQSNSDMPEPGSLQFHINTRNYGPGPLRYVLESVDVRIGTRASVKYKKDSVQGYMARGAARTVRPDSFKPGDLSEFFGKGITEGSIDFSICYGPPEGPLVRRLQMSLQLFFVFPKEAGGGLGYSDSIILERDESISRP